MVRELSRIASAPGLDKSYRLANEKDVEQNLSNLSVAWQDLLYAVAGPDSQNVISVLKALTSAVESFTEVARRHPGAVKDIGTAVAALGAALTVLGSAAVIGAVFRFSGAIRLLTAALGVSAAGGAAGAAAGAAGASRIPLLGALGIYGGAAGGAALLGPSQEKAGATVRFDVEFTSRSFTA